MSSKAVTQPFQVVTNGDMSGTVISLESSVTTQDNAGYQVSYTGSPVGEFTVEATIDGVNWSALDFGTPMTVDLSPSGFLINMNQLPYAKIRLKYVPDSGSGTMQATAMVKRLGG